MKNYFISTTQTTLNSGHQRPPNCIKINKAICHDLNIRIFDIDLRFFCQILALVQILCQKHSSFLSQISLKSCFPKNIHLLTEISKLIIVVTTQKMPESLLCVKIWVRENLHSCIFSAAVYSKRIRRSGVFPLNFFIYSKV